MLPLMSGMILVSKRLFKNLILIVSVLFTITACYTLISPDMDSSSSDQLAESVMLEASTPDIQAPVVNIEIDQDIQASDLTTVSHIIKSGQTLSSIFSSLELNSNDLLQIINANDTGKLFASIRPGKQLVAKIDSNGVLQELSYAKNSFEMLTAKRIDDHFEVKLHSKPVEKKIASAHGVIHSSLFLDGKNAGLPDKIIMELANIFAWDIDFALSLREGDQFTVVYEKLFVDNKESGIGDIVSAEFINQGKTYTAVRFKDPDGNINYYTPDGKSLRKAFLRTPVDFARISSHFNLRRKHPVLNRIRAHKGVDYAARTGTPVKTTGDGKITFRGRKRGYGRVVIVQHGQKYTTLYAHLSAFKKGQRVGKRVKQGQVIGYVGMSGLATGPHLHYEFRVNGVHRNPLTVKLPHATPVNNSLLAEFNKQTQPLIDQLNKIKAHSLLAHNQQ